MKNGRKRYEAGFKAQVALAAMQERETLAQLSRKFGVHPVLISQWKKQLLDGAASAFERSAEPDDGRRQEELLRKIGELTMERDFLARGLRRSH